MYERKEVRQFCMRRQTNGLKINFSTSFVYQDILFLILNEIKKKGGLMK